MARRNRSFQDVFFESLDNAGRTALGVGESLRAGERLEMEQELQPARKQEAEASAGKAKLDFEGVMREKSIQDQLDAETAKPAGEQSADAQYALWDRLNRLPQGTTKLKAEQARIEAKSKKDEATETEKFRGTVDSATDLSDADKAFYRANPEKYGERLKPVGVTYLPGEGGYVGVPSRLGPGGKAGAATPVKDETGAPVKPKPTPSQKTPEEIEREAEARARGAAAGAADKGLSGDAAKLSGVASSAKAQGAKLDAMIREKGIRWVVAQYKVGNPDVSNIIDDLADAKGRIRSGGAVNKDEGDRFKKPFTGTGNLIFGNDEAALEAVAQIMGEADEILTKMAKPGKVGKPTKPKEDPLGLF